ncbi:hypothetical protein ACTTAL_10455 [Rhodobacter capsulatus]
MLPVERKQIVGPDRRQQQGAGARLRELDVLDPAQGRMPLIGRERELSDLRAWLDDEVDISVHALIGSAGTGKTRLSIGLCAAIDGGATPGAGWLAGFLSPAHLPRLADAFATTAFDWTRSTLLVIDYAAQGYEALGRWLDHLAAGPRLEGAKLRILLLERQAPRGIRLVAGALRLAAECCGGAARSVLATAPGSAGGAGRHRGAAADSGRGAWRDGGPAPDRAAARATGQGRSGS